MSLLNILLPEKLNQPNHKDYRKSVIFVYSSLITSIFLILYDVYFITTYPENKLKNTTNIVGTLLYFCILLYFRISQSTKNALVLVMLISSPLTFVSIYNTGGIYSIDVIWLLLIIACAYLFAGFALGNFLSIVSMIYIFILYYIDTSQTTNFKKYIIENASSHNIFTFVFVCVMFMVLLISFNRTLEMNNRTIEEMKQKQIDELAQKVKEKTDEINQLRQELAKDFHDEMGNKLASITILSQSIGYKMDLDKDYNELKDMLHTIETRSKELYHGTKDFIWSIDFKSDYVDEWFIYIRDFGEDFFEKMDISFYSSSNIQAQQELKFKPTVSKELIYILKEIMTNAAKHANATQVELLVFQNKSDFIEIHFSDNGIGLTNTENNKRGLKNIENRIDKINSQLNIETNKANGTIFKISVPLST